MCDEDLIPVEQRIVDALIEIDEDTPPREGLILRYTAPWHEEEDVMAGLRGMADRGLLERHEYTIAGAMVVEWQPTTRLIDQIADELSAVLPD